MASRRVRIKGIANIPQRKKPGNGPADSEKNFSEVKSEQKEHNLPVSPPSVKENKDEGKETEVPQETENEPKSDKIAQAAVSLCTPVIIVNLPVAPPKENSEKRDIAVTPKKEIEEANNVINITSSEDVEKPSENTSKDTCQPSINGGLPKPTLPVRRRFLKPSVSSNIINRRLKEKVEEPKAEQDKENLQEPVNINLNETVISTNTTNISPLIQKIDSTSLGPYITKPGLPQHLVKYNKENSAKSGSDTEYPPPPPSPNKLLNRTRIKAVPRLDQRRTSFSIGSASESEDDTRRSYTRIRNDSVCSVTSGVNETQPSTEATSSVRKELISVIQRKCRRTEQSRKLAEARREFYMKFHNGTPDKQRLTMIDLIFYNPTSNPMTQKKKRKISELKDEPESMSKLQNNEHIASKLEKMEEERTDDPLALSDDDENEVLAPQIKIGLNGEIVVDEKSLVIEHTDAKKGREALENSEIVDGDFDTNYGVYKRVKRSKDWSREETLRFYKALNTIGTDFTMMCELFPKRTRRELKMKFKKEERMNRNLVDKAVMRPVEFDMTELRRDLEVEERREEEMKRRKKEREEMREKIKTRRKKSEIKGIDELNEQENKVPVKKLPSRREKKSVKSSYDVLRNGINSVLEDSDDNLPTTYNKKSDSREESSEEDDPLFTPIAPKKRLSKPKTKKNKRFKKNVIKSEEENNVTEDRNKSDEEKQCKELIKNNESLNQNLEPGSIMIVSSKMPNGETLYKVFMVTDQQNKQPINLEPNVLQNLTQNLGVQQATTNYQNILTISAQKRVENNVTINEEEGLQESIRSESDSMLIVNNGTEIITSDNIPVEQNIPENCSEITSDSIIFPFDEYLNSAKQNITISHEDSKLVIVTEKSNN